MKPALLQSDALRQQLAPLQQRWRALAPRERLGATLGGALTWWMGYGAERAYEHMTHKHADSRALRWLRNPNRGRRKGGNGSPARPISVSPRRNMHCWNWHGTMASGMLFCSVRCRSRAICRITRRCHRCRCCRRKRCCCCRAARNC